MVDAALPAKNSPLSSFHSSYSLNDLNQQQEDIKFETNTTSNFSLIETNTTRTQINNKNSTEQDGEEVNLDYLSNSSAYSNDMSYRLNEPAVNDQFEINQITGKYIFFKY